MVMNLFYWLKGPFGCRALGLTCEVRFWSRALRNLMVPRYWEEREKIGLEMQSLLNKRLQGVRAPRVSGLLGFRG